MLNLIIILGSILLTLVLLEALLKSKMKSLALKTSNIELETSSKIQNYKAIENKIEKQIMNLVLTEQALKHISDGIVVIKNNCLSYVNPAMEKITGYSSEELTSRPWRSFMCEIDKEKTINAHDENFSYVEEIEGIFHVITRWRKKDGEMITLWWSISLEDEDGICYATCKDVSRHNGKKEKIESIIQNLLKKEYTIEIPFLGYRNENMTDDTAKYTLRSGHEQK